MNTAGNVRTAGMLVFALCLVTALVTNAQMHNLNTLHAKYTNAVSQIDAQYEKNLSGLLSSLKAKGDFDGYKAVKQAIENHRSGPLIFGATEESPLVMTDDCRKQFDTFKSQSLGQKIELQSKYIVALQELLKKLMEADRMDAAEAVNTEIKAQTAMLADLQSERPGTESIAKTPDDNDKQVAAEPPNNTKGKALFEGAVEYKGHHYLLYMDKDNWQSASFACTAKGGHLVVISDAAENDFVYRMMKQHFGVWIGLYKSVETWRWVTTEQSEFKNWGPKEPHIPRGAKSPRIGVGVCCALMGEQKPPYEVWSGKWADRFGDSNQIKGYICEWEY